MKARKHISAIGLLGACTLILAQTIGVSYAHENRRWQRRSHYRHYRFYPRDFYLRLRIYHHPSKRYYYYYDVYPEKRYYYDWEKKVPAANPDYLPVTSIANMASQGVPDSVIIAEIERTRSVYQLTSEVITYLKQNNVSDRVIDVMLETGKKR